MIVGVIAEAAAGEGVRRSIMHRLHSKLTHLGILAVVVGGLADCATKPPASNPEALALYEQTNDPLEPTNRFLYRVNNALEQYVLHPVAEAYAKLP